MWGAPSLSFHQESMYSKSSRNTTGSGSRKSNMTRYQETANYEDRRDPPRYSQDSIIANSPLYNTSNQSTSMTEPTKLSLADVDFSSTPISDQKTRKQTKQRKLRTNHLSRLHQAGIFDDEESPTSVLDLHAANLWHQHLNRLLDESSGELEKLVLVSDNARSLPRSYQSTPKRPSRPIASKKLIVPSKYRPCRWNSEASAPSSSGDSDQTKSLTPPTLPTSSSSSLSSPRLPPPPFLVTSPVARSPRPLSVVSSSDTQPVLPSRSQLDVSEHCELPSIRRTRRNRGRQLRRHTSDSALHRPERKDSESGEETSEELGFRDSI